MTDITMKEIVAAHEKAKAELFGTLPVTLLHTKYEFSIARESALIELIKERSKELQTWKERTYYLLHTNEGQSQDEALKELDNRIAYDSSCVNEKRLGER